MFWFRKCDVLFITYLVDIVYDKVNNCYSNNLIDGFLLTNDGQVKYVLQTGLDHGKVGKFKVEPNLYSDTFSPIRTLIRRILILDYRLIRNSRFIYSELLRMDNRFSDLVSVEWIRNSLINYFTDYYFYKVIFFVIKPRILVSSEVTGRALVASAKCFNIKVLDLQHGIIDPEHPQYIIDPFFRMNDGFDSIPDCIGVFGELHARNLIESNFWKKSEVFAFGSYRIQKIRDLKASENVSSDLFIVLLPTQWNVTNKLVSLLNTISKLFEGNFYLYLKLHPLEPKANIDLLNKFASKNIVIISPELDIYSFILKSNCVIGYDSAVLIESLALGKPVMTISTNDNPKGIASYFTQLTELEALTIAYSELEVESYLINSINNRSTTNPSNLKNSEFSHLLYSDNLELRWKTFLDHTYKC